MPARIATNNLHSSNSINTIVTSGLVCHYDAWVKANSTQWSDLTSNNYHITGSGISSMTFSNDPGIGVSYKTIGSGHYVTLPNINSTGLFSTIAETIELYIYPQSNNSVWFTETSNGVNSGWHVAKILIYNGYFYLIKWNGYVVSCLLGKAVLNSWNHVVWRQSVDNSLITTNFSYGFFNFGPVNAGTITLPSNVYIKPGLYRAYCTLTTSYNYNGVTGRLRLVPQDGTVYSMWIENNGTGTSTTTNAITLSLSPSSFPIAIQLEVYYGGWYLTNSSGSVTIDYGTSRLDGFLNGAVSSFEQCNGRQTPWLNNGASTIYMPCVAYDSTTYGTAADPSGYVNTIRIYNRALTNDEVLQNYNCFKNRYYLKGQNAPNVPPVILNYGNAGSTQDMGSWWGDWNGYDVPGTQNTCQNIGVDFDFYFYGTNYGRGQNGSIWIHTFGALGFGTASNTYDWQPSTGKALLLGWSNGRASPWGSYSGHSSLTNGYSERSLFYSVRNSNSYTYTPGYTYTSYYGWQQYQPGYNSWDDYTYWQYTIRMARTNTHQYIDIRCTNSASIQGRWQICTGVNLYNIQALTAGQSMVLVSDAFGANWTVLYPYYINEGIAVDPIDNYNVFMRYDANKLNREYAAGSVITKWANTGNVNFIDMTAIGYGSPTLTWNGRNFWVNFSTSNQYFAIPQFNTNWIISRGGFTIAYSAYFSSPGSYSWNRIIDFGNGADSDNIGIGKYGTGTSMGFFINNSSTRLLTSYSPTTPADGNWHVVLISVACTTNQIVVTWYDNSTSGTSYTYTGNFITEKNLYNNYIGKSNWPSDASFFGGMQEILFIQGALNANDSGNLITYLKNKWQI